jgi:hypothetical protein
MAMRAMTVTPWLRPLATTPSRQLGPFDERIAHALYHAQTDGPMALLGARLPDRRPRSFDEIVAMAPAGLDWNRVFKQLKAEGLIQEQTLGHVLARWAGRPRGGGPVSAKPPAPLRAVPSHAASRIASR